MFRTMHQSKNDSRPAFTGVDLPFLCGPFVSAPNRLVENHSTKETVNGLSLSHERPRIPVLLLLIIAFILIITRIVVVQFVCGWAGGDSRNSTKLSTGFHGFIVKTACSD